MRVLAMRGLGPLLALLLPAAAHAQWRDSIVAGARVLVERRGMPRLRLVGDLVRYDSILIVVDPERGGETIAVPLARGVTVDVSEGVHGSRGRGAVRGAAIGFGVGLGAALIATAATAIGESRDESSDDLIIPGWVVVGVLGAAGTVVTTVAGGALGALWGRGERWVRVWPAP